MARYVGHAVDQYGRDIPGAYVTVVGMDGSAATLTDDYGNPISQPLKTDDFGGYYFNTTDGLYTITTTRSGEVIAKEYNVVIGILPTTDGFQIALAAEASSRVAGDALVAGNAATALASEVARATTAEQAEVTRATGVEAGLDTRLTTTESEIDDLQTVSNLGGSIPYDTYADAVADFTPYASGTAYTVGKRATDQGALWLNILAGTGVAPPTLPTTSNANWQLAKNPVAGQAIVIPITDTGTHTDPTTGTTVTNTGIHVWATGTSGTGFHYLYPTDAALAKPYADAAAASATSAAASAASLSTNLVATVPTPVATVNGKSVSATGVVAPQGGYAYAGSPLSASTTSISVSANPVTGSGNHLAIWYSDSAGTTFLSASTEVGNGTAYTNYSLTKPAGALYVRINTQPSAPVSLSIVGPASGLSTTVASLSATTSYVPAMQAAMLENTLQVGTYTANQRVGSDGTLSTASGRGNALFVLPANCTAVSITATSIDSGFPAAVWFTDTAGTALLTPTTQNGGTTYTNLALAVPPGAKSIRVNGSPAIPVVVATSISVNMANRLAAIEAAKPAQVYAALTAPIIQTATVVSNANIGPNGVIATGTAGYTYALFPIADVTSVTTASGTVVGTGRDLVYYYNSTTVFDNTTYIGQQFAGSNLPGTTYTDQALTIPAGTKTVGVNSQVGKLLNLKITQVDPTIGAKVASIKIGSFVGAKLTTEGDSITAQQQWQAYLLTMLGFGTLVNTGVSGTRIAYISSHTDDAQCMCDDARVNTIPADTDVLTVMGGTNDHGQNIPLGAITAKSVRSGFDATTFYGACELMAVKHLTRLPTKRILYMGQTYADRGSIAPAGWADSLTNTQGLTQWDYANALKAVADKYGIPFLSMIDECGWSTTNISSFITAESGSTDGYIHPDARGGKRMAGPIAERLRQLQIPA